MFFYKLTIVFFTICLISIFSAEIILPASFKLKMPKNVILSIGFAAFVFLNHVLLNFFYIQICFLITMLIYFIWACFNFRNFKFYNFRNNFKQYSKVLFVLYFLFNIFFMPLHLSRNYGPFTDGGGDVSIYSDLAKTIYKEKKAAFGFNDTLARAKRLLNINEYFESIKNRKYDANYIKKVNPPLAEFSTNRIIAFRGYGSSHFSPIVAWFFISSNMQVNFYVLLAFMFSLIVTISYIFLKKFGSLPALIGSGLLISSLGFIAVFYNMYFLHSFSLFISTLFLYLIDDSQIQSKTKHLVLLLLISAITSHYPITLGLILPFLPYYIYKSRRSFLSFDIKITPKFLFICVGLFIYVYWLIFDLLATTMLAVLEIAINLFSGLKNGNLLTYQGEGITLFQKKWITFYSGLSSQQYFEPLSHIHQSIEKIITHGNSIVIIAFFLSTFSLFYIYFCRKIPIFHNYKKLIFNFFITLIIIFFYALLGKPSTYTSAKSAQYIFIFFILNILISPMGFLYLHKKEITNFGKVLLFSNIFILILLVFFALIPRTYFLIQMAEGNNRSRILESSYFDVTDRLLTNQSLETRNHLILVEPVKSADVYLNIQPFFGYNMMSTRFLVYTNMQIENSKKDHAYRVTNESQVFGLDFVSRIDDLTATFIIFPVKPNSESTFYNWQELNLGLVKNPYLLITADHYEKFYSQENLKENKIKRFSFIRNGSCGVILPTSEKQTEVLVEIIPQSQNDITKLSESLSQNNNFKISIQEKRLFGKITIPPNQKNIFVNLMKSNDSMYSISVQVNNQNIIN